MARLQNPTSKINNSDDIEVQVQARSLRALQDQLVNRHRQRSRIWGANVQPRKPWGSHDVKGCPKMTFQITGELPREPVHLRQLVVLTWKVPLRVVCRITSKDCCPAGAVSGLPALISLVPPNQYTDAWTALADDEAARENLTDINAGQTHRANLALRVSDQQFDVSADIPGVGYGDARYRGSDRARGGGRGGRGGGHAGSRRSRHGPTR